MKNLLSTLLFCTLLFFTLSAQNNRTGSFVANDPGVYPISGDVTLIDNAGTLTVVFESNFATVQGLALEVFLSKTNSLNTGTDIKISTAPLDQGTATNTPITGMRTFAVPAGITPYDFDNVLIQCTSINELWGHANLCKNTVDLNAGTLATDTYRAEQIINSSVALANGANVVFETASCASLNPGFCVPSSTAFTTLVGVAYGCIIQ